MNQYDSRSRWSHDRQPESCTPIYDRLLAEWREAGRSPERGVPVAPGRVGKSAFVPAARSAGRPGGG